MLNPLLGSLRISVPESNVLSLMGNQISWIDTGSWDWTILIYQTHWYWTKSVTCWFCWMCYPKREVSIRIILSSFTFPTGRISFKARREVSIEAGRWKLNLYSLFLSQLKDTSEETLKLLEMDFHVNVVISVNFLHKDKIYKQWILTL